MNMFWNSWVPREFSKIMQFQIKKCISTFFTYLPFTPPGFILLFITCCKQTSYENTQMQMSKCGRVHKYPEVTWTGSNILAYAAISLACSESLHMHVMEHQLGVCQESRSENKQRFVTYCTSHRCISILLI